MLDETNWKTEPEEENRGWEREKKCDKEWRQVEDINENP